MNTVTSYAAALWKPVTVLQATLETPAVIFQIVWQIQIVSKLDLNNNNNNWDVTKWR